MADEAILIELFNGGRPIRYTVANALAVPKGSLMELDTDRTLIIHSGADEPIVGIAAHEKVALDGSTQMSVWTDGIFDITAAAGGVTALGAWCAGSATVNMITAADGDDFLQSSTVGQCLEAHGNDEVAAVRINK